MRFRCNLNKMWLNDQSKQARKSQKLNDLEISNCTSLNTILLIFQCDGNARIPLQVIVPPHLDQQVNPTVWVSWRVIRRPLRTDCPPVSFLVPVLPFYWAWSL